ncbi:DUF2637 domain-containing protein [Streptomyces sp. NPDC086549]|uniref:DUF2637 domain-containing protein n=1 Tax=Streptomyces sp. NPDC086549 TaxID=3365752 RepID=UPI0038215B60
MRPADSAPPASPGTPRFLSRAQRAVAGTVITGTLAIAGIGFAGSYQAIRDLAIKKDFGTFSYVFPIGIDAGICVLLALDLLLTWIRIPFPLLRQTAWLLTAATIAFNGAAAWPNPLGVGMHAVIPILFVVAVEAARHAIGLIADITADKHMEGVRLTRWLLSPLPTFLLWRRMKLWELRSYEQVIKLEQERLVYQARLHARFGRAWRRKAPVESLMPLRLARYGIPLAETAPAGLTAAGIQPVLTPAAPPQAAPATTGTREPPEAHSAEPDAADAGSRTAGAQAGISAPPNRHHPNPTSNNTRQPEYQQAPGQSCWLQAREQTNPQGGHGPQPVHGEPNNRQQPEPLEQPAPKNADSLPTPDRTIRTRHDVGNRAAASVEADHQEPEHPANSGEPAASSLNAGQPRPPLHGLAAAPQPSRPASARARRQADAPRPTTVDRYYAGWHSFKQQHGREPDTTELSAHLAHHGVLDRRGQPVKPKSLARYLLGFRIYAVWAQHQASTDNPNLAQVATQLAQSGITGQYNRPIEEADLKRHHETFERRWLALRQDR